jgi:hypothetical protein
MVIETGLSQTSGEHSLLAGANFMFKENLIGRVWRYARRTNATSNGRTHAAPLRTNSL